MRKLLKIAIVIALFVSLGSAQTSLNWKGYDTCNLINFAKDTFRLSKTMNLTNAENKLLVFVYDDTVHAARASDSLVAEIGYQLGAPVITLAGLLDTIWTSGIVLDTINSQTEGKRYNPVKYTAANTWPLTRTTETTSRPAGLIDTIISTSSSAIFLPFTPFWSPYVRFYIKGLTGNSGTFIRGKFIFEQRGWIYTKES
jgi:hypothetical protein